jgi:hypothetical protein
MKFRLWQGETTVEDVHGLVALNGVCNASPLQLSSFDAGPLSLRPRARFRAGIFLLNDALPKAANRISDVRDATNSTRARVCVARRPRSHVGGVMDASRCLF